MHRTSYARPSLRPYWVSGVAVRPFLSTPNLTLVWFADFASSERQRMKRTVKFVVTTMMTTHMPLNRGATVNSHRSRDLSHPDDLDRLITMVSEHIGFR